MNEIEDRPNYAGRIIIGKGIDLTKGSYGCPGMMISTPVFEAVFLDHPVTDFNDMLKMTTSAISAISPAAIYLDKNEASKLYERFGKIKPNLHGVDKVDYFDSDDEEALLVIYYKEELSNEQLMDNKRAIRNIIDGNAEILTLELKKDGRYVHAPFDHSLIYKEKPITEEYIQRATEYLLNFFNENDIGSIEELNKVMNQEFFVDENNEGFIKTEMTQSNMDTEAHTIGYIEHHKGVLVDIKINTELGYSKIMVKNNFDIPEYIPFAESGAGNFRREKKTNSILISNVKEELGSLKESLQN